MLSRHPRQAHLKRFRLLATALFLGSTLGPWLGPLKSVLAATPAGTTITNQATGSFEDPDNLGVKLESTSNQVIVEVSEVAGITISNAGVIDDGQVDPGDTIDYQFTITNTGNADTLFFIPDSPESVTNGTFNLGANPIEIIAYDPDGSGASASVDLSSNNITIPSGGANTATLLSAIAAANNGVFPPDATLTISVPVTVNSVGMNNGDSVIVEMGNTTDSGSGTQNQADSTDGSNTNEVRTVDPTTADTSDDPTNGEREASTEQTTTVVVSGSPPASGPQVCAAGGTYANWSGVGNSGTGSFSGSAVMPGFTWSVTGDVDSVTLDSGEDFFESGVDSTVAIEEYFGEADSASNLNVRVNDAGSSGAGDPVTSAPLTITFNSDTPSSGWGFSIIDLDVDQVLVRAKDENGVDVPLSTIDGWFVEVFDADPVQDGLATPHWDSDDAAAIGSNMSVTTYGTTTVSGSDNEAGGIWFYPDISLSSLTLTLEDRVGLNPSVHYHIASCLAESFDYGDAPDTYGTDSTANNNGNTAPAGPSHSLDSNLRIGTAPDTELDAATPLDGSGDGADEGLITISDLDTGDSSYTLNNIAVTNNTGDSANLVGWIDFDGNGTFDSDEAATVPIPSNGSQTASLTWSSTPGITGGTTYARFRLATDTSVLTGVANTSSPTGPALNGEVEDYQISITGLQVINCPDGSTATGSGYASSGSGLYKDDIFWLDWTCGGTTQFNPGDEVRKSWTGPSGITISATVSNITAIITPYNTGDWVGDTLDQLYGGLNPIGLANLNSGEDPTFDISFSMSFNGVPIPTDIVTAEAEDTAAAPGESATWTTDGDAWQPIDVLAGSSLFAQFSNAGQTIYMTDNTDAAIGGSLVALTENVSTISVDFKAGGREALAFGIMAPFDFGDANGFADSAGHFTRRTATGGSQPTTLTDVNSLTLATLVNDSPYLGTVGPDVENAESTDQPTVDADGDDTSGVDDEDGITALGALSTSDSTYTATITVNNTNSSDPANLLAWIDFDQSQTFDEDELATISVEAGDTASVTAGQVDAGSSGTLTLTWSSLIGIVPGTTYVRVRMSTDPTLVTSTDGGEDESSLAAAYDGEMEDFSLPVTGVPDVLLVKRITAINGQTTNPNDGTTQLNQVIDDTTSAYQDDDNNAGWPSSYLVGAIDAGPVNPGDEIEYTVYFLGSGNAAAENVRICDLIQPGQSFQLGSYDSGNADVQLQLGTSSILNLTAANDIGVSGDRVELIPSQQTVANCNLKADNDTGVLVIDITGEANTGEPAITELPNSQGTGTPNNSYGFFRFVTKVDE